MATRTIEEELELRSWLGARLAGAGWCLLILGVLLSLPILYGLSLFVLVPIVVVAAVFAAIWVAIRRFASAGARARAPGPQWLRALLIFAGMLSILVALPIYYLAVVSESRPVIMPQVVLSNGERTVTFQGMMHVGSESFYKSVVYDLTRARADGYTMYFEGIQPSNPEADAWFSNTLAGGGDLSANYDALARTCGLKFQLDYFEFLAPEIEAQPDRFVNADVTTADMMAEAERLADGDPEFADALGEISDMVNAAGASAALDGFVRLQNEGTEGQKEIAGIVCRGVMSLLHGGGVTAEGTGTALDPVILDFRNRELADRILTASDERTFVTYGAGHLPGVIEILKAAEPAWGVESVKWVRAISPPDDFDAILVGTNTVDGESDGTN